MPHSIESSTLRILKPGGKTVGTGFLVAPNLAVTCAHVAVAAGAIAGDPVQVQFTGRDEKIPALVVPKYWRDADTGDVAFLQLGRIPEGVAPLRLGLAEHSHQGNAFRSFGYATAAKIEGIFANGTIDGYLREHQLVQMQSPQANHGISGGPVLDEKRGVIVGMITMGHTELGRNEQTTFATPAELLFGICPEIRPSETCPYRGLETFTAETAEVFCGREALTEKLLTALRGGCRFLAVFGPSGSGKSSVVRAGLLPKLESGLLAGWKQIIIRPADEPFAQLQASGLNLLAEVTARSVLFIDQFEELFTLCPEDQRVKFINALAAALNDSRFLLIISMRDDFYSAFNAKATPLAQSGHLKIENVPETLKPDELVAMIEQPAATAGLALEAGLTELIINDLTRNGEARSSTLPLLEFALLQLWEKRRDGRLTHAAYQAIGGVTGSLARWADEAYNDLPKDSQYLAESLLISLVHLGDETQGLPDTRKRRPRTDFDEQSMGVVRHFADRRLLVTSGEIVELVHDALVREWSRLQGWLKNNRVQLRLLEDVSESAKAWSIDPQNPDLLDHRGGRLEDALKLQNRLNGQERAYLAACRTAEQRRKNVALLSLGVVAIILAILGGFGWYQARIANQEAQKARQQELSALALANIVNERTDLAILTSVQTYRHSLELSQLPALPSPQRALLTTAQETSRIDRFLWDPNARNIRAVIYLDQNTVVYGNDDGQVVFYDLEQARQRHVLQYRGSVKSFALSPDGQILAMATCSAITINASEPCRGEIKFWDLMQDKEVAGPAGQGNMSSQVAFSPDGRFLVFGDSRKLRTWEVEHQKWQAGVQVSADIRSAAFHPNGSLLALGLSNGEIQIVRAETGQILKNLTSSSTTYTVAFHPDGNILAAGTSDNQVILWDTQTWKIQATIRGHRNPVMAITFSADGKTMASASFGMLKLFNFEQGQVREKETLTGYGYLVADIAFSPDGQTLASATRQSVLLWNTEAPPLFEILSSDKRVIYAHGANERPDIMALAFSKDDQVLVSVDKTAEIIFRYMNGRPPLSNELTPEHLSATVFAISGDATLLAYALPPQENNDTCTIELFSPAENEMVRDFACQDVPGALALSAEGKFLALGTEDGHITVWNISTGETIFTQAGHPGMVYGLAFEPQSRLLASSGCAQKDVENCTQGEIRLWDVRNGHEKAKISGHSSLVRTVVFSPNGAMLASGGRDGDVLLWDVATFSQIGAPLVGHASYVNVLAFSPDGSILASASSDLHIILWDVQLQQRIGAALTGHTSAIRALAFSHTGSTLVSGDNHGNIFRWNIAPEALANGLCAIIGRNFTRAEWVQYFSGEPYRATCPQWALEPELIPTFTP